MAAVTYSDGLEVQNGLTKNRPVCIWTSPATMDSADTVDVPTITGRTVYMLAAWDGTTGDAVTATVSSQTITVDAAGGTTDHVYTLMFYYK